MRANDELVMSPVVKPVTNPIKYVAKTRIEVEVWVGLDDHAHVHEGAMGEDSAREAVARVASCIEEWVDKNLLDMTDAEAQGAYSAAAWLRESADE